jgi:hypothetical protein
MSHFFLVEWGCHRDVDWREVGILSLNFHFVGLPSTIVLLFTFKLKSERGFHRIESRNHLQCLNPSREGWVTCVKHLGDRSSLSRCWHNALRPSLVHTYFVPGTYWEGVHEATSYSSLEPLNRDKQKAPHVFSSHSTQGDGAQWVFLVRHESIWV